MGDQSHHHYQISSSQQAKAQKINPSSMESSLCSLRYGRITAALPAYHLPPGRARPPATLRANITTCHCFDHSPYRNNLFISKHKHSSTTQWACSPVTRANNIIDAFSTLYSPNDHDYDLRVDDNDFSHDTIMAKAKTVGASLALACVVGAVSLGLSGCSKAMITSRQNHQALAIGPDTLPGTITSSYVTTGKAAITSLMEVSKYLSSGTELKEPTRFGSRRLARMFPIHESDNERKNRPSKSDVDEIYKKQAILLMKSGKSDEAVDLLKKECQYWAGDPEPEYFLGMALVEILISQGKYEEAKYCDCLNETLIQEKRNRYGQFPNESDSRFPLYKAIIYTMTDDPGRANAWWKEFIKTIGSGPV